MKIAQPIFFVLMLMVFSAIELSARTSRVDSILLERIYSFPQNYTYGVSGFATNVYIKHLYQTHRRNAGLWVIPSTYAIAKGRRSFVSEQYSRLYFRSMSDFDHLRQVYYTTIPRNRRTLPILTEFITPNLYEVTMYGDHILSPFCKQNRLYYKYSSAYIGHGKVRLYFRPRIIPNTQLVKGKAIVDQVTGQIEQVEMEGEFDMIRFRTLTMQGDNGARALLPKLCRTSIEFKFLGNHVTSDFTALYDCPITLPDTFSVKGDRMLIDSLRPISLSEPEVAVYHVYDSLHAEVPDTLADQLSEPDTATIALLKHEMTPYTELEAETEHKRRDLLKEIGWDIIGSNLINGLGTSSENGYLKLSPLLNPQYISYSNSKGFSYKLRLRGEYRFGPNTTLKLRPYVGYAFKHHQFYYNIPLWLHYSPKLDATWYINVSKSNRISNANVLEDIKLRLSTEEGMHAEDQQWHYFGDDEVHLQHSINLSPQLSLATGLIYHHRSGVHSSELRRLGLTHRYESLAPTLSFGWRPWPKAPMFTIDYERSITSKRLNIDYERWEADASVMYHFDHLQTLNLRLGGGIYTRRMGNYFMDFANFRDNNLPEGWDDDWAGEFQLLDSRVYNASKYYVRGNISYETPLMGAFLVPVLGRFVERERFYWSSLGIESTRLYSELGYGFTTRLFSMGLFASFLNLDYQEMTAKFTFELFRRW